MSGMFGISKKEMQLIKKIRKTKDADEKKRLQKELEDLKNG
ncbi:hypothetical protein [Sulfurovum sp.]|nr:hypothetical protein [Sulfurovum sp.]